jgi:hypothetical protein
MRIAQRIGICDGRASKLVTLVPKLIYLFAEDNYKCSTALRRDEN